MDLNNATDVSLEVDYKTGIYSVSNNGAVYCTGSLYLVNHWVL